MSKSPAAIVKQQFGDKAKLVAALGPFTTSEDLWVGRLNENKGLERVSNAKLLRLHGVLTAVKEKFGTRAKLIDAICEVEKRTKDDGFKKRLSAYPVPRLFDAYRSAAKRAGIKTEVKPSDARKAAPKVAAAPKAPKEAKAAAKPAAKKASAAPKGGTSKSSKSSASKKR